MKQQWKLVCHPQGQCSIEKASNIPFEGTFTEMMSEIDKVNSKNLSYKIVDFKLISTAAKRKTVIILMPIEDGDRKVLEHIENKVYKDSDAIRDDVERHGVNTDLLIYELTDFMNEFNNEEIADSNWWLGYAQINEERGGGK